MAFKNLLTDWRHNLGTLWFWLGVILIAFDFIWVGINRFEFPYGLVYGLDFIVVGLVLGAQKPKVLTGLVAAALGFLVVISEASAWTALSVTTAEIITFLLFGLVVVVEMGWINIGGQALKEAKYMSLITIFAWVAWPAMYFYNRLMSNGALPLTLETVTYHGGIMAFAAVDLITFFGAWKILGKRYPYVRLLLFLVGVFGAYLTVGVAGWGLSLI